MRKVLAITLAAMLLLSLVSTAFAQPPEIPGPKKSLVALGDSITAGHGLENNLNMVSRKAYPQLLGDEIGYRVTNLAVSGMTSCEVLDAVQNNSRYRNAISKADMIILNVGGADMLGFLREFMNPLTPEPSPELFIGTLSANISSILGEVGALNPGVPILLFNIYEPYPVTIALDDEVFAELEGLLLGVNNMVIGSYALIPTVYIVDAYATFDEFDECKYVKAALLFVDEVHPSELGQQLLCEEVLSALPLTMASGL